MSWVATLYGVAAYEFRMQLRRRSVLLVLSGLGVLTLLVARPDLMDCKRIGVPPNVYTKCTAVSIHDAAVSWAIAVNTVLPIALGILLADRLVREEHLNVADLFSSLPISPSMRLLGKYLGALLATMLPIALVFVIGLDYIIATWHDTSAVPLALLAFLTINVPGVLFVAAFSLACPLIMPVPVYQVLYTGYWFWGNLLPTGFGRFLGIPTLSGTILTPMGSIRAGYLFGVGSRLPVGPNPALGYASIVALLLCAGLALYAAWRYQSWRRARQ
jgi:ABC-2 type transport system permease protein